MSSRLKRLRKTLLIAGLLSSMWSSKTFETSKTLEGSPIYIPKRHKFKRRLHK